MDLEKTQDTHFLNDFIEKAEKSELPRDVFLDKYIHRLKKEIYYLDKAIKEDLENNLE